MPNQLDREHHLQLQPAACSLNRQAELISSFELHQTKSCPPEASRVWFLPLKDTQP